MSIEWHPMSRQTPFKTLFIARLKSVLLLGVAVRRIYSEGQVKTNLHKAKDIKSGETVLDRSNRFTVKEVRFSAEHGLIAFVDVEGVWHGAYHADEYLGVEDYPVVTDLPEALQAAFEWLMSSKLSARKATLN
jgi:hypothetical protein